ncbi:MAG TPA: carboxypeptidase-like regulatory domain-containing protein, partial [Saprospiraceae bacterium]|nr:carboxypeptidase-like regulatory domain-containing protein [Saprospiraceae bacterium]
MVKIFYAFIIILVSQAIMAQTKHTLSGYVRDKASGETLIGANVFNVSNPGQGTTTNTYGFYSLTLDAGIYNIGVSYLGFENQIIEVNLENNLSKNIEMSEGVIMEEVVISAEKEERRKNVEGTQMGTVELPVENIKKLPAIF